ncbi:ABC transporter substrate-binding protein [Cupriavidus sp. IDO]|uniref:ABC transporter substrate-binding protein n=1 Tax=Cupriavidus sp. IDO TaxID=1539142 RepID=UPI0005799358|nr:ABC transporter substrate-binding protein [Cupriavidus sp. IDO]KWR81273.1 nitrate ABC transporter substrate-binding protein [Cupriavidus sp. IDO]
MPRLENPGRRRVLQTSLLAGGLAASGALLSVRALATERAAVSMQLGWVPGGNQVAEVVAKRLGYYEQEGIDFKIQPGGPNIDGVAIVASGRGEVGQISSSPSVMLAVSEGLPVKCFAVGLQQHPYAFFSLKKTPIRSPQDMIGKRIGIQATGLVLLKALLAKHKIAESQVNIVPIGADMMPLLSGRVDAVTGWQTNVSALKALGADRVDLSLWDSGVRLYALPYYAHTNTLRNHPEVLQRFLRATARGWLYANKNRDQAVDLLLKDYPSLNHADERASIDSLMGYAFNKESGTQGWGAMDPAVWQEQISLYAQLGQFRARAPRLEDVMTLDILQATKSYRLPV